MKPRNPVVRELIKKPKVSGKHKKPSKKELILKSKERDQK